MSHEPLVMPDRLRGDRAQMPPKCPTCECYQVPCKYQHCRVGKMICACETVEGEYLTEVHAGECALAMLHLQQVEIAKYGRFLQKVTNSLRFDLGRIVTEEKR